LGGLDPATFEIGPSGAAAELAVRVGAGIPGGAEAVRARVVDEDAGQAVLEGPESNWGANVPLLLSSLVAGEAMELRRPAAVLVGAGVATAVEALSR